MLERFKEYSPVLLRVSISLVFLWFAFNQLIFTDNFIGFIPDWVVSAFGVSPALFVIANGVLELIFGLFLIIGINVRLSAFILGLHLFGISLSLGYGPTMIRDLGLSIATLVVLLNGKDRFCIEK